MKTARIKLVWLVSAALVIGSCTNLDENLRDSFTPNNFLKNASELDAALLGAYSPLFSWNNHGNYFSLQEVSTDEAMIPQRGGDWFDGGQPAGVHTHAYAPNYDFVANLYNTAFGGVSAANRLLATPGVTDPYTISELKVLRAYYYWVLLDNYGNVPLATEFGKSQGQKTRAEIYAFIDSELSSYLPVLKARSTDDVGKTYGRLNYWAGQAIAVKLYLNAKVYTGTPQYDKAIAAADEIINSGKFSLESSYKKVFSSTNKGSKEHIWVIPYDRAFGPGFNLVQMTLHYGSQQTYQLQQQPWNGYCSLEDFYNSYNISDNRKANNFVVGPQYIFGTTNQVQDQSFEAGDLDGAGLNFTPKVNELAPNALRQAGARIGKYEFAIGALPNLDNDVPLYRLADIMLSKAEALFRKNGYGDAAGLALVNIVHARAGLANYASITVDEFFAERGREMAFESWRRNDLIRFGMYESPWFGKLATDADTHRQLYPIPLTAITASAGEGTPLVQNPGY